LINNGIHAGEPDGIDATMQLFRDLARRCQNTIISTIPIYNIGGALIEIRLQEQIKTDQKYMVLEVTEEIMI
jgi:hypothetical protein